MTFFVLISQLLFYGGQEQAKTKFFSISKLEYISIGIQLQESSHTFDKVSELR